LVIFRRLALVAAILLATSTRAIDAQQADMDARLVRVEQWMKAVMRHEPGATDAAAMDVGAWTAAQVRALWVDANVLVQIMRNPKGLRFTVRAEGERAARPISYSSGQMRRLRVLACAAGGIVTEDVCTSIKAWIELDADLQQLARRAAASRAGGDDNYLLRRGALLHADIEMLLPVARELLPNAGQSSAGSGPQRFRMTTSDGVAIELNQVATHWELARMLLDYVRPNGTDRVTPGRDDMVRRWYRATAAWMQLHEDYDTLHIDRARAIVPADPDIMFLSGCLRELYAAPLVQNAMREATPPRGVAFDVGSDRAELRHAETFFRGALAARPAFPEAHLRLGRVLALLERPADAVVELREALASTDESLLRYYGQLFAGGAEEALGRFDAAQEAYEAAAALYPTAQSPRIALSALARRRGDRGAALRAIQQMFELPPAPPARDDPWWSYHLAQARNTDEWLEELRRPFLAEKRR
jgi:hypothetical protein